MTVTSSFLTFVIDQFASFSEVTTKRMFGGVGLYHDEMMFGLIADDVVFFKVDDVSRIAFETRGMGVFRPSKARPHVALLSYYQLPEEVLNDTDLLRDWTKHARAAARASRGSARKSTAKRTRAKTR